MADELVWVNEEYLGAGYVLQHAEYPKIGTSSEGKFIKDADSGPYKMVSEDNGGENQIRYRIKHMSEIIENYNELQQDAIERFGEAMLRDQ